MPDIVLLSKIYYSCDSFQKVQENLEVSKQALYFRLLDLFREYLPSNEDRFKQAIDDYIQRQNASIVLLFHEIKEQIISEFNQYRPSLKNNFKIVLFIKDLFLAKSYQNYLNKKIGKPLSKV